MSAIQPQRKYGWHGQTEQDDAREHHRLTRRVNQLEAHIRGLNEIIDALVAALPDRPALDCVVEQINKSQGFVPSVKSADLVAQLRGMVEVQPVQEASEMFGGYRRVPTQLKGNPDRVPEGHFLFVSL